MAQHSDEAVPSSARQLRTPAALALADLAAIFDDLQFVLQCCERLIAELGRKERDEILTESLWVAALSSYMRCFRTGERGMSLTEDDLAATNLKGKVVEWHRLLKKLRDFYVEGATNPREMFSAGVAQSSDGAAQGVVITSVPQPHLDETTVQQTGRLAFELSRVVDERIKEQQQKVFQAAEKMSVASLNKLPTIAVGSPA
jgi:hypothetical protein